MGLLSAGEHLPFIIEKNRHNLQTQLNLMILFTIVKKQVLLCGIERRQVVQTRNLQANAKLFSRRCYDVNCRYELPGARIFVV